MAYTVLAAVDLAEAPSREVNTVPGAAEPFYGYRLCDDLLEAVFFGWAPRPEAFLPGWERAAAPG